MDKLLQEYKKLLSEYLRFKTISTDPSYKSEFAKQIAWLSELFKQNGFEVSVIDGKETNPYIVAEYKLSEEAKTVMIYGHYDVQPASIEDGWNFDPFELNEKDGRLYARGVVDNKGQHLIHIVAIFELIKSKKLNCNIKFFLEGNEETGNQEMSDIVRENKELLKSDLIMVSDGEIVGDRASMEVSFRGVANLTLKITTAENNLHSGICGGAVPSASHELAKIVAKLYDDKNLINIEGYYDSVLPVTQSELENNKSMEFDMNELTRFTGIKELLKEEEYDFYTQVGLRPSITVTGIKSGYIGDGYNNIVPSTAEAKINFRFVNNQDPQTCIDLFEKFVKKNLPSYASYTIDLSGYSHPIRIDIDSADFKKAREILAKSFETEPVLKNVGGSIPAINDFKSELGKDTISISLGNEDCNMHGTDENFKISLIEKSLRFSMDYFAS